MAIAGLVVHCLKETVDGIMAVVDSMPEMTVFGVEQDQYVVVVAEAPSSFMEKTVEKLQKIEGVLAVYTTSINIEDELADVCE